MKRRQFLRTTAAAGLALSATSLYAEDFSRFRTKRVGLIGTGWFGKCALFRLLQIAQVNVVALCDVDSQMLSQAADLVMERQKVKKRPKLYGDYRKMLKENKFDIVLVSTPDHWHALPMIAAMEAGADVWVEKPISVDVIEGQAMLAAARKYGRVVQVDTERRSTPHLAEARKQIIQAGKLGKVGHIDICSYYHMRARQNPPDEAPPAHLDYEMWTGPAPMRPYNPMVHPRSWRAFMEYGNGIIGDMCIHMFDMVRWMLDLGWPKRISSSGGILMDKQSKANITDTQTATFEYEDLTITWQHRTWGDAADKEYPWSATLYGDKGTLKADVHKYDFTPRGKGEAVHKDVTYELEQFPEDKTEERLEKHVAPALRAHMKDFLVAIEKRSKPVADIEQGYISSASCILANLALETGTTVEWDPVKGRAIGNPKVNKILARPYRAPWKHPHPRDFQ